MKGTRLLIILAIFCLNSITAQPNPPQNRLLFDVTRPVNELIVKNISRQEFRSDVLSAFLLIGANVTNSTIFYSAEGRNIEELESRTTAACKAIHETLRRKYNPRLLISWMLIGTSQNIQNFSRPFNKFFYGYTPKLLLRFNDDTECYRSKIFSLEIAQLLDSKDGLFAGISYDESLAGCFLIHEWQKYASIDVVNLKFGTTRGVTESFGLFQTRIKFLTEKFIAKDQNKQLLYYPNPYSVGDDVHQRLLIKFARIWTTSFNTQGSILLQVPNSRNKATTTSQFSLIPKLSVEQVHVGTLDEDIRLSFLLFLASFQRHQKIVVNLCLWELWKHLPEENTRIQKIRNSMLSVDLILDYSLPKYGCGQLNNASFYPLHVNASESETILIKIEKDLWPSMPPEIAKRITPKSTIGCIYIRNFEEKHQILNESDVEHVLKACHSINGSIYILTQTVTLEWFKQMEEYSFYFENSIREKLHAVNRFRKEILQKDPVAEVYLELDIGDFGRHKVTGEAQLNSLFCEELVPAVNFYFEGIFNWAKLEKFPTIMQGFFGSPINYFSRWFTLLRRLNYPYQEWALKEQTQLDLSGVNSPAFLSQDYLKSVLNWEPDACIDWTAKRWEIPDDFFHNPKIGTVFYPNSILKNWTSTKDDYMTMLNFLFYRFRLVEISISFDFSKLMAAIEHKLVSEFNSNTQIFINYAMTGKGLPEISSFFAQLKKSKMCQKGLLKGVHTKLVDLEITSNSGNVESVLTMIKYAKLSNLSCGIELHSVKMCNQMLQKIIFSEEYSKFVSNVNYLVCKEHIKSWYGKPQLQTMLDSHLAMKRTLNLLIPQIRVYFRVQMDFENGQSNATLDKYTGLLALLKMFGTKYDIIYFFGVAFDGQLTLKKNGWWGISNYSDLNNPYSYVEKVSVLRGQLMWYPPPSPSKALSNPETSSVTIISSVSAAVLFLLLVFGICFGWRYRNLRHLSRFLTDSEVQEFLNGRIPANIQPTNMEMELMGSVELEHMKFNPKYKLNMSDIIIDFEKILGSGAFGIVYKGLTKNIPAAIKRPNADSSKNTFKSVLTEVKVLAFIGDHSNVVGFLGAYVEEIHNGVLYISTELCSGGSLEAFLRKKSKVISQTADNQNANNKTNESSELGIHELNTFAKEIAQGMEYIESRRVIHGDLATRNVLLDDNLVCKIGDFGLSRKLYEYQKYVKTSQEPLPWKWMAPESLTKMEFTSKSDVWSYGVTIWEIYSLGKIPYAGLNWSVDFTKDLQNGLRLTIPDFAPENIFSKILECWNINPDERPTFADFVNFYKNLGESSYTVLDLAE